MAIYWGLFLTIILINFIPISTSNFDRTKLIVSFLLIFLYASLRANGFDYEAYEDTFYEIKNYYKSSNFESRMEEGYVLLNYIMPSYRFLLVFLSAFTCVTYYWLFKRFIPSKYYWLGFVLLAISVDKMLLFQISGLRNAIAINIMTLSVPLIIERKIKPYILLTVLAYFFHNSVLFFMPLAYFVATPNKFSKRDMFLWGSFFLFFITVSSTSLLDSASSFINVYFDRYSTYTEMAEENAYERSKLMYVFVLIVMSLSFVLLRETSLSNRDIVIIKLSMLFFFSLVLGTLNFRMSQYFAPFLILSCFIFINRSKISKIKYSYLIVTFLFLLYSYFVVFMGNKENALYEYKTILE